VLTCTYRYRKPTVYTLQQYLVGDFESFAAFDPATSSVGGNTGGVNTFSGFDPADITGGVYNFQNLLDGKGDNFICFCGYPQLLYLMPTYSVMAS
jgi:hypothetical protein